MNLEKPAGYDEMIGSGSPEVTEALKEMVAQGVEKLNNELIQSIVATVSGLEIEQIEGDEVAPGGYYQFRVSMAKGTDITGTAMQSAVNALQDFLDYATGVVRDVAEGQGEFF